VAQPALESDPRVQAVFPNYRSMHVRHQNPIPHPWVPNDPYFNVHTPVSGWPGEWHLQNQAPLASYNAGQDVKATDAWNAGWTGFYIIVGVVDDGIDTSHEDLPRDAADQFDFGQNDSDPNHVYSDDQHGTSTSGVAAARGGNGKGTC